MTDTIWKFPLQNPVRDGATNPQKIHVSELMKPLSLLIQNDFPTLYVQTEKAAMKTRDWNVWVLGTGWDIPEGLTLQFIGTVIDSQGYVWHVWIERDTVTPAA